MGMVFLISVLLMLIIYLQGMPLVRQRKWRELVAFGLLLSLAGYLMYGEAMDFFIPNPADFIRFLTQPFSGN